MQYTLTINQRAVIENGWDVDISDLAILDYIAHFAHCPSCVKMELNGSVYYMISHQLIIQELPILGVKTGAGIINKINKLIAAGLLERYEGCERMHKTLYRFGKNYEKVYFTQNETAQPSKKFDGNPKKDLSVTLNKNLGYQNNNNISDNNKADIITGEIFSDGEIEVVETFRGTSENKKVLFSQSRFFDIEKFKAALAKESAAGIDVEYYYYSVADWSASKGEKRKNWISTARIFIRNDVDRKTLHMKEPERPYGAPRSVEEMTREEKLEVYSRMMSTLQ